MGTLLLLVLIGSGFGTYIFYPKRLTTDGVDKDYFYIRYSRNKLQIEISIILFQCLILDHKCNNDIVKEGITVEHYLINIQADYLATYSEAIIKTFKKGRFTQKDKKYYSKTLVNQSEKLFDIENELQLLNLR